MNISSAFQTYVEYPRQNSYYVQTILSPTRAFIFSSTGIRSIHTLKAKLFHYRKLILTLLPISLVSK